MSGNTGNQSIDKREKANNRQKNVGRWPKRNT